MAESEKNPLLEHEEGMVDKETELPPPPYQPEVPKSDIPAPPSYPKSMPLPTYTQSEKYEREGVLDLTDQVPILVHSDNESSDEGELTESEVDNRGNCCEFIIFFMVTLIFSVVGFIFAICLATTAASQGGALAGLGMAFIAKPFLFEMYDKKHISDYIYTNTCQECSNVEKCQFYVFHGIRLLFWFVGIIGFILFFKGVSKYVSTRGRRPTTSN